MYLECLLSCILLANAAPCQIMLHCGAAKIDLRFSFFAEALFLVTPALLLNGSVQMNKRAEFLYARL